MIKSRFKRIVSVAASAAMLSLSMVISGFSSAQAAENSSKISFDLGANAQSGYNFISASQGYNSSLGYGFSGTGVKNVTASGSGALSDAVQFTDNKTTFNIDLEKGLYKIEVVLGNTNRTSVYMENMLQIVNMTGNNAYDSVIIPVTDGQLNIRAAAGKAGYAFSISEIDITKISVDPTPPPTVWFCGDSTVCNYYPLETSVQAGWGQMINKFIDPKWNVRDMAASGQYAKGFIDAGQFKAIEYYGKAGDIFIVSIGINDTNYSNAEEYYQTVTDMVKRAKAKDMTVYLVKQQGRNGDAQRNPLLTGRWFGGQLDQIGKEQNVKVIDLFNLFQNYCISIGAEKTNELYMTGDTLHPNRAGALKLAELAANEIDWDQQKTEGAILDTAKTYRIKNKNSGLYMSVENLSAENGTNVSQQNDTEINSGNVWSFKQAENGYYYVYSAVGKGEYLLNLTQGKTVSGTNIDIYQNTNSDAQLFKFIDNNDGSYVIVTKATSDKSAVEVKDALGTPGGNIQQWEINGHACQSWILEPVVYAGDSDDNIIVGDLNYDGKINVFDYIILKRKANDFKGFERQFADTNSDGLVNIDDIKSMESFLIKKGGFDAVEKKSRLYYADEASFSQGETENINSGFKKDSYLNLNNMKGSFVEWNVNAPEKGNYLCTFNIANGTASNRIMKISVNNSSDYWMQDFLSTEQWTSWQARGIVLPLNKGKNIIRMTSATENGGPNIDTLYMELTDEPIAEVYVPAEPDIPDKPTGNRQIFIAGDSTVQTYRASYAPQQGWGAYLQDNLPDGYTVSNHAIAGRSSKSFYDNGRLDEILNKMNKGDYLLIQFGINDSAASNAERYAPTSGSVPGAEGSFEYYMSKYIEGAIEKGGNPVLVTTVLGLKAYNNSKKTFEGSYSNYCNAMKQLAAYYKIPCIDLNSLMVDHYNSIGYDAAYQYHMCSTGSTDMTHFTETGAKAVAKLVADEIKKQNILK